MRGNLNLYSSNSLGVIVCARMSSTRLPGKFLRKVKDKLIADYILERLQVFFPQANIVIATSDHAEDGQIEDYCKQKNIKCFRGSLNNVAERFLLAAEENNFQNVVRVCGDNIFLDATLIEQIWHIMLEKSVDFISNTKGRTFPLGMSVEIVKTAFYRQVYQQFQQSDDFEHITRYLYQHEDSINHYYMINNELPQAKGLNFAIDRREHLELAERVVEKMEKAHYLYGWQEVYKLSTQI